MKRFSKILVAALALCLLVGALALAVSADSGITGTYVVNGNGYDSLSEAVANANNTETIYLNGNATLDSQWIISGADTKVILDLNGYTLTVGDMGDVTKAIVVQNGASFTLTGSGAVKDVDLIFVQVTNTGSTFNLEASGNGITLDSKANETTGLNYFDIGKGTTANVKGKLTVNTTAVTGDRNVFKVASATLNIKGADITIAKPDVAGAPDGSLIYTTAAANAKTDINIDDSVIDAIYAKVFKIASGSIIGVSDYITGDTTDGLVWADGAADAVKVSDKIITNFTATDSKLTARLDGYATAFGSDYSFGSVGNGGVKMDFIGCEITASERWIYGSANTAFAKKALSSAFITFDGCTLINGGEGKADTSDVIAMLGPNSRFLNSILVDPSNLNNGSAFYLELADKFDDGTNAWTGCYVDNVIMTGNNGGSNKVTTSNYTVIYTINPEAKRMSAICLNINGENVLFTQNYFSDASKYYEYESLGTFGAYDKAKVDMTGLVTETTQIGSSEGMVANPVSAFWTTPSTGNHYVVVEENGNAYYKWDVPSDSAAKTGNTDMYGIATGAHNLVIDKTTYSNSNLLGTDLFVYEFDIKTEDGLYPYINNYIQQQFSKNIFNSAGTVIDSVKPGTLTSGSNYVNASPLMRTNGKSELGLKLGTYGGTVSIPTDGTWGRLTYVIDVDRSYTLETVTIPAYAKVDGAYEESGTATVKGYKYNSIKYHVFFNGELVGTLTAGFNSDILNAFCYNIDTDGDGTADSAYVIPSAKLQCYVKLIRQGNANTVVSGKDSSLCIDNLHVAFYPSTLGAYDAGIYNADGSVKTSLIGNPEFLVMPYNADHMEFDKTIPAAPAYAATVDGVKYATEAEAIAAIKEGSVLELNANFTTLINKGSTSFTVKTNGYTVAGFISSTHKVVEYTALGYIDIVPANTSDIYKVKYEFGGKTHYEEAGLGTVLVKTQETFPSVSEGNASIVVTDWTLPQIVATFNLATREIVATPVTESVVAIFKVGDALCADLSSAIEAAKASGEAIVLLDNIEISSTVQLTAATDNVTINLNGYKVTAAASVTDYLFKLTGGSKLTFTGEGAFLNVPACLVYAQNAGSKVTVDATGAGISITHGTVASDANIDTFWATASSEVEVSGKITVQTTCTANSRTIFKLSDNTAGGTVTLKGAHIVSALPTEGSKWGQIFYMKNSHVNINDSTIDAIGATLFNVAGGSAMELSSSDIAKNAEGVYEWADKAAAAAKYTMSDKMANTLKATNSVISITAGGLTGNSYSVGNISGYTKADFYNCDLLASSRFFYGNTGGQINSSKTNTTQISFYNSNIVSSRDTTGFGANQQVGVYGISIRMIGGSFYNAGELAVGATPYLELNDKHADGTNAWLGSYVENVLYGGSYTGYEKPVDNWSNSFARPDGTVQVSGKRVERIINGTAYTFDTGFFNDMELYNSYKFIAHDNYNGYVSENPLPSTSTVPSFFVKPGVGTTTNVTDDNGNGYLKWFVAKGEAKASNNTDHTFGGTNKAYGITTGGANAGFTNMLGVKTFVLEFDIKTDDGRFPLTNGNFQTQMNIPLFANDGTSLIGAKPGTTAGTYVAGGNNYFQPTALRTNSHAGKGVGDYGAGKYLPLDGTWSRLTYIIDVDRSLILEDVTIPSYKLDSDEKTYVPDGGTVTKQAYKVNSLNYHLYVDGEYVGTNSYVVGTIFNNTMDVLAQFCYILDTDDDGIGDSAYVVPDKNLQCYIKLIRIPNVNGSSEGDASMCIDNVRTAYYLASGKVDLGLYNAEGAPVASLVGNPEFLVMPDNNNYGVAKDEGGAIVDGTFYKTDAEAIAAIKEGSVVKLTDNFLTTIEKDVNYKVFCGEYELPTFVSANYKVSATYVAAGYYQITVASEDEKFTVSYEYDGITENQIAALGTAMKVPSVFDAYNKSNPKLDTTAKTYTYVEWTLSKVVTANTSAVATPVVVDAVVVEYKNGEEILDTDYYYPGAKTELDAFDGTLPETDTTPDYYSIAFGGWNASDLAAATAGLANGGTYVVNATFTKVSPDTFPAGIKINLTLYSSFIMNFYIPAEIEGIENVRISTDAKGSLLVPANEPGTFGDVLYSRYSWAVDVANTENLEFYIVYNVEGTNVAYRIEYSVAKYAGDALYQYKGNEKVESLIANMANYVNEVKDVLGEERVTLYDSIIAHENYSKYIASYDREYAGAEKTSGAAVSFHFSTRAPSFVITAPGATSVQVKYGNGDFADAMQVGDVFYAYEPTSVSDNASLSLYKMTEEVTFVVDGSTVTYSLGAFIAECEDAQQLEAAKALYQFAEAARAYKNK